VDVPELAASGPLLLRQVGIWNSNAKSTSSRAPRRPTMLMSRRRLRLFMLLGRRLLLLLLLLLI
jgi:hypothetical protein